jgi:uncharacterized membrane protein
MMLRVCSRSKKILKVLGGDFMVMSQRTVMYGPMQLFVIAFPGNKFSGEVLPAINDARDTGLIRMIDYVFVSKDEKGKITSVKGTDLGRKEIEQFGSVLGALIGLGAGGMEGAKVGAAEGARFGEHDVGYSKKDIRDIAENLPNNSSALLMLVEHLWAKGIKQALVNSGGIMLAQGMLTPEVVVEIGAALREQA